MQEESRRRQRRRLDEELRPFRRAARDTRPTNGLLRAVRRALGIPVAEMEEKLGVVNSVVFALELSEVDNTIQLKTLSRVADAMDCIVVYGIVPRHGLTLEALAAEQKVKRVLNSRERKDRERGNREQNGGERENEGVSEQDVASSSQLSAVRSLEEELCAASPLETAEAGNEDGLKLRLNDCD